MSRIIFALIILLASMSAAPNEGKLFFNDICPYTTKQEICAVRFESVYAYRDFMVGKGIAIYGILVVTENNRSGESGFPLLLLFPSVERARMCDIRFAVEIAPSSLDYAEKISDSDIELADGRFVYVSGIFHLDTEGRYWGQIEAIRGLTAISNKHTFDCTPKVSPSASR